MLSTPVIPVLVVNDTRVDRHHGCARVMQALFALMARHSMAPVLAWPAHSEWRGNPAFAAALGRARLVIINGEGTIHHDRAAGLRLLEIGAAARERGIPAALINCGWEANGAQAAALLRDFALVCVRDSESAAQMRARGQHASVVPDLSLHLPAPEAGAGRTGIGFTDNVDRLGALALESARKTCGGTTVSIHQPAAWARFLRGGLSLREDLAHPARLAALLALRHRLWRASREDTDAFIRGLGTLSLLVSGRYHACTLALAAGTPFIATASNTGKIAHLIADAGLEPWRAQTALSAAAIRMAADAGFSPAEEAARLEYLNAARTCADALFADLRKLAS